MHIIMNAWEVSNPLLREKWRKWRKHYVEEDSERLRNSTDLFRHRID
jgi:hypothetical protein